MSRRRRLGAPLFISRAASGMGKKAYAHRLPSHNRVHQHSAGLSTDLAVVDLTRGQSVSRLNGNLSCLITACERLPWPHLCIIHHVVALLKGLQGPLRLRLDGRYRAGRYQLGAHRLLRRSKGLDPAKQENRARAC